MAANDVWGNSWLASWGGSWRSAAEAPAVATAGGGVAEILPQTLPLAQVQDERDLLEILPLALLFLRAP